MTPREKITGLSGEGSLLPVMKIRKVLCLVEGSHYYKITFHYPIVDMQISIIIKIFDDMEEKNSDSVNVWK